MARRPDITGQLPGAQALRLAKTIIRDGSTIFTRHARHEMEDDDLLETDVVNAISGGVISEPGELGHQGDWCYRVRTIRVTVVILFRSVEEMVVVTAWREQRRGR
jgi:Domain of unknown function (DUF4258)